MYLSTRHCDVVALEDRRSSNGCKTHSSRFKTTHMGSINVATAVGRKPTIKFKVGLLVAGGGSPSFV